jgi:hypothetical protein
MNLPSIRGPPAQHLPPLEAWHPPTVMFLWIQRRIWGSLAKYAGKGLHLHFYHLIADLAVATVAQPVPLSGGGHRRALPYATHVGCI